MIVGVSGHRNLINPSMAKAVAKTALAMLEPKKVLTGMALGWDTIIAELCIEMSIPFVAAVPFHGQELKWPKEQQSHYHNLLSKAESVWIGSSKFSKKAFFVRNCYIVDNSDIILAAFDGRKHGGTWHAIQYAVSQNKEVAKVWPPDFFQ